MIDINNLKVAYGKHTVLQNLDLCIDAQTVHGLVGLNGSGKTTLLNTIFGIKKQDAGTILMQGQKLHKSNIGYLETENYFYPRIRGKEYLEIFKTQNHSFDIDKWNGLFGLPLNKLIDEYSTGMKKKLALLGIICLNRRFLILDEPFNGIDMETVQKLKSLFRQLQNTGITILITSHILESLVGICDKISYLNSGKIEFTKQKDNFANLEKEIFSLHQEKIDSTVEELVRKTTF